MQLVVDRVPLGPYGANCYVVRAGPDASEVVVVDPGDDVAPLGPVVERATAILVTHDDVDHVGGVAELAARTGAEVWAPAGDLEALAAGRSRTGNPVPAFADARGVTGGETLRLAGLPFEVVDTPGHAANHVAYCVGGHLFSGDLLFAGSVGRVDLPGGDWATLLASVETLLERYGPDATVWSGHGPKTTLGHELETNPFLAELRAARQS
jgi:glyoxylase-like metal-dependent hydrolase (beta-lactamase superfamily II)